MQNSTNLRVLEIYARFVADCIINAGNWLPLIVNFSSLSALKRSIKSVNFRTFIKRLSKFENVFYTCFHVLCMLLFIFINIFPFNGNIQVVSAGSVRAFISRLNSIHVSFLMYFVNLNIFTRSQWYLCVRFWCRVSGILCSLRLLVSSTLLLHSMFH